MNIYASNLSFNVKDEDLKKIFAPYGEISSAKVIIDKITNQSRGFGFIEMPDEAASKKAIAELDGTSVDNRTIKVMEAKPREDKPFRNNNNFSGNSGDGFNNANSFNKNRY
ncbi:MAG TPA: RNA-binding protein [Flavisolibacter sp.]|jgi:RNA recognition motif-containing protein|nr:RNA-binding protein [Flavisolibacter sp.]